MNRNDEIKTERRRRTSGATTGRAMRLAVDETKLDREKYEYRFVNNDPARLHALTVSDDWEIVPDRNATITGNADMGAKASVHAGTTEQGHAQRAVLCRKLKTYYNDDQAQKQRAIDEREASLKSGAVPGAGKGEVYSPSASSIGRD